MKVLKWILIVIVGIIAIFLIYSASQPSTLKVSKSITINVSAAQAFGEVTNFENWDQWASWNQKDTNMKVEITGEMGQVGAKSQWWSDHPEVGNGSQEIVEARENEYFKTEMRFDGWDDPSYAEFIFTEGEEGTTVEWTFDGAETPFYMNWMNSLMAPMIEQSYDQSLSQLKTLLESSPAEVPNPMGLEVVDFEPINILSIKDSTNAAGIGDKLAELYTELSVYIEMDENVSSAGMPLALYYSYSEDKVVMEAGIPVEGQTTPTGRIVQRETPSGKSIKGIHYGSYDASGTMHEGIEAYMNASKMEFREACIEIYANDPTLVDSAAVETHIIYPVK